MRINMTQAATNEIHTLTCAMIDLLEEHRGTADIVYLRDPTQPTAVETIEQGEAEALQWVLNSNFVIISIKINP